MTKKDVSFREHISEIIFGFHAWMNQAACVDEVALFSSDKAFLVPAQKLVCKSCPVVVDCLEYAMDVEKNKEGYFVMGGLTAKERHDLRMKNPYIWGKGKSF